MDRNDSPFEWYHMISRGCPAVPDLLIRDFSADDLSLLDDQARRLGISRAEHVRRQLHQTARRTSSRVTTADLAALSEVITDLGDEAVVEQAWS